MFAPCSHTWHTLYDFFFLSFDIYFHFISNSNSFFGSSINYYSSFSILLIRCGQIGINSNFCGQMDINSNFCSQMKYNNNFFFKKLKKRKKMCWDGSYSHFNWFFLLIKSVRQQTISKNTQFIHEIPCQCIF